MVPPPPPPPTPPPPPLSAVEGDCLCLFGVACVKVLKKKTGCLPGGAFHVYRRSTAPPRPISVTIAKACAPVNRQAISRLSNRPTARRLASPLLRANAERSHSPPHPTPPPPTPPPPWGWVGWLPPPPPPPVSLPGNCFQGVCGVVGGWGGPGGCLGCLVI